VFWKIKSNHPKERKGKEEKETGLKARMGMRGLKYMVMS